MLLRLATARIVNSPRGLHSARCWRLGTPGDEQLFRAVFAKTTWWQGAQDLQWDGALSQPCFGAATERPSLTVGESVGRLCSLIRMRFRSVPALNCFTHWIRRNASQTSQTCDFSFFCNCSRGYVCLLSTNPCILIILMDMFFWKNSYWSIIFRVWFASGEITSTLSHNRTYFLGISCSKRKWICLSWTLNKLSQLIQTFSHAATKSGWVVGKVLLW